MGYLSNANGTRLHITTGWVNKLVYNNYFNNNFNLKRIKHVNRFSLTRFEECKKKIVFRNFFLFHKPNISFSSNKFKVQVNYLTFFYRVIYCIHAHNSFIKTFRATNFYLLSDIINLTQDRKDIEEIKELFKARYRIMSINTYSQLYKNYISLILSLMDFPKMTLCFGDKDPKDFLKLNDEHIREFMNYNYARVIMKHQFMYVARLTCPDRLPAFIHELRVKEHKLRRSLGRLLFRFANGHLSDLLLNYKSKGKKIMNLKNFKFRTRPYSFLKNNSTFMMHFIMKKLRANYRIVGLLSPIIRELKATASYAGFKIRARGRFNKTRRAFYRNWKFGKTSLNSFCQQIDYTATAIPLRYGVSSVKLWLHHAEDTRKAFFLKVKRLDNDFLPPEFTEN